MKKRPGKRRDARAGGAGTDAELTAAKLEALDEVIEETRLFFHCLRAVAEEMHERGELTAGLRGILQLLHRFGPRTVPQMARSRSVARQHVQVLVNRLQDLGYVELRDNPEHKRSSLVALTTDGREVFEAMKRREESLMARLQMEASEEGLRRSADVLRSLRESMESRQWRRSF
jgi:DNA-binding MarR family transcriptional regulator